MERLLGTSSLALVLRSRFIFSFLYIRVSLLYYFFCYRLVIVFELLLQIFDHKIERSIFLVLIKVIMKDSHCSLQRRLSRIMITLKSGFHNGF